MSGLTQESLNRDLGVRGRERTGFQVWGPIYQVPFQTLSESMRLSKLKLSKLT